MASSVPLVAWKYLCGACDKWYEHYSAVPNVYGEFLMRSEDGKSERVLRAWIDPVFDELGRLLKTYESLASLSEGRRAEVFQRVFGITCDPAENGSPFRLNRRPPCSHCGATAVKNWSEINPPVAVDVDIPDATHQRWLTLNQDERRRLLATAIGEWAREDREN